MKPLLSVFPLIVLQRSISLRENRSRHNAFTIQALHLLRAPFRVVRSDVATVFGRDDFLFQFAFDPKDVDCVCHGPVRCL